MTWHLFDLRRDDDTTIAGRRIVDDEDGYRSETVRFAGIDETLAVTGGSHVVTGRRRGRGVGAACLAVWEPEDVVVTVRLDGVVIGPDGAKAPAGWTRNGMTARAKAGAAAARRTARR